MEKKVIDLNCDMGESFGAWKMGSDAELMNWVSSVNIACGFHAGDPTVIRETAALALAKGIAVGAHPSYPDLQGFGRREMKMAPAEVFDIVLYQVAALKGICEALGGRLSHVKPHGALYNQAARARELAAAIAGAVRKADAELVLFGLAGSVSIDEGIKAGLRTASEVFADRTYQADGSLTPRSRPGALIASADEATAQVLTMITDQTVTATTGESVPILAETVCIHGDGAQAVEFAKALNRALTEAGVAIRRV